MNDPLFQPGKWYPASGLLPAIGTIVLIDLGDNECFTATVEQDIPEDAEELADFDPDNDGYHFVCVRTAEPWELDDVHRFMLLPE